MSFDGSNLPISGGLILAGIAYVAISVFAAGPLVAERTIERSNWHAVCEKNLQAEVLEQRTLPQIIPRTDCNSIFGSLMPELGTLCREYGNPDFGGPATEMLRQQEQARQEAEARRLARAASNSGSKCDCAASIVAENRNWAITAGSLRLISPASTRENLQSELVRALRSSHCSGRE